jgi:hypothetical protein
MLADGGAALTSIGDMLLELRKVETIKSDLRYEKLDDVTLVAQYPHVHGSIPSKFNAAPFIACV